MELNKFVRASDDCNDQGMVSYIVFELQAYLGHMVGVHHLKQLNRAKLLSRKIEPSETFIKEN